MLAEAGDLHDMKQADYGRGDDPFANVRSSSEWGMAAWVGAMVRATDKIKRLQTYARKGELANESVLDSFMDLAVYALIGRVLFEQEDAESALRLMAAARDWDDEELESKHDFGPDPQPQSYCCDPGDCACRSKARCE